MKAEKIEEKIKYLLKKLLFQKLKDTSGNDLIKYYVISKII